MFPVQSPAGRLGHSFHAPASWDEASSLLAQHGTEAAVSAGATYLMWRAARGEPMPPHLISLHRIPNHDEVVDGSVGALASLRSVARGPRTSAENPLRSRASLETPMGS